MANLHDAIERWSWTRQDLFENFVHLGIGQEAKDRNVLDQDQYWTVKLETHKIMHFPPLFKFQPQAIKWLIFLVLVIFHEKTKAKKYE